jgi:acetolactate synthase-1/2/3 large subunit
VEQAAALAAAAKRPMIMLGAGAQHAGAEIAELAALLQAPVTAHRSGRGILPEDEPPFLNLAAAYPLWLETDLLIAVGTRMELQYLRWRKIPDGLRIVRIDIDPLEMTRRRATVGLVTDARLGVAALVAALRPRLAPRASRAEAFARAAGEARRRHSGVQPQLAYLDAIRAVLPRDGFFVEEICQVGFAARFAFPVFRPRTYVSCGYQDNLGYGFNTALGVKVAHPEKAVVSISGDGGFLYGVQELATAVQHGIAIAAIVFDNRGFGNVRRDQEARGRPLGAELHSPDFCALARSFGANAERAESPDALAAALRRALAADRATLIEVPVEPGSEASPWPFLHPPPTP